MGFIASLMNIFSAPPESASATHPVAQEEYKGFFVIATPAAEGSQFRINGLISKDKREHIFIRADVLATSELCVQETLRKAKLMIDQQGERIFN